MDLKGTQTEKNLLAAFSGESMARNKYTFFAEAAKKEGHTDIAALFEQMAQNESTHGKLLYKMLYGEIGSSAANLKNAMDGEFGEWTSMYPDFARTAQKEGLPDAADLFKRIADIEKDHEHRFLMALAQLTVSAKNKQGEGVKKAPPAEDPLGVTVEGYRCQFCGATYEKRPDVCSLCGAIGAFESSTFTKPVA